MKKNVSIREEKGDTLLDHLLYHRGIIDEKEREEFLNPVYETGLHDPFLLQSMDKAVERIEKAIENKEKIVIYSDFDADGIPAAVALAHFFKDIGHTNVEHYIPHRHNEGFGVHLKALDKIKEAGVDLMITLDCGIADVEEAKRAKELGIDLIITDHHLPRQSQTSAGLVDELPEAIAIINPKRSDCEYPDKMLCGAGVAFKLIQALLAKNRYGLKEGREKWLLDMVGLATLSDMVPLRGENRIFAKYGLTVLQKSPRLGLAHLLSSLKVNQRNLTEDDVQFMITPRINVASRMGDPRDAFMLLSTTDFSEADRLVRMLNDLNDERKGSVGVIVKEINKTIKKRELENAPVIVLGNPNWRPALLGLVATSIVRDYGKPVFLWGRAHNEESENDKDATGMLKGSCRSDGATNMLEVMRQTGDGVFEQFGGHTMAGGFEVTNENIHKLEDELTKAYLAINEDPKAIEDILYVDRKITIDDVNWITWRTVEKLAPFGMGNPKPLFMFENAELSDIRKFGKAKEHIELIFRNSLDKNVGAISFFAPEMPNLKKGDRVSFLANMEKSTYRNFPELRLRIVDIL